MATPTRHSIPAHLRCEYFLYFQLQHPGRPTRECTNRVTEKIQYSKTGEDILVCSQHAPRVRASNSAFTRQSGSQS
jgi:hypothetical protein